jgi:hypothetical protein
VHRTFLAVLLRRVLACVIVLAGTFAALPAQAVDRKAEQEAQALEKKAIEEDSLNMNYAGAVKKLQAAIGKCDGDKCGAPIRAALLRDLGAMQILNSDADGGKASFAQALAIDASLDLDPAYKTPQVEQAWNEVKAGKKKGPPPPKEEPSGPPASQPAGDFAHTPAPEALVRTPLPIYAEYSGSETLARVIVKYKAPGMGDWKPLELPKLSGGWGAIIPCKDVAQGTIQYYIQGFNAANDPVATSGTRSKPFTVPVKQSIAGSPPALPGQEAPKQCSETSGAAVECPPDFPGCNNKKGPGEDCKKDSECASNSCVDDKCADKKPGGAKCDADDECASGNCTEGSCTAPKKAGGETCTDNDECESGTCKEGTCEGEGSGKGKKFWIGVTVSGSFYFVPSTTDVCTLADPVTAPNSTATPGTTPLTPNNPYWCVDPNSGQNFPGTNQLTNDRIAKNGNLVQSGFAPQLGQWRVLLSFDYALNQNMMLGARLGYVFGTDPASTVGAPFPPIHLEARFTYLLGKGPIQPMAFLGAGAGEFDAFVPVPVFLNACDPTTKPACAMNMTQPKQQTTENAWITAGPVFGVIGVGARVRFAKRFALSLAGKAEAAAGGSAGALIGIGPEVGIQYGF